MRSNGVFPFQLLGSFDHFSMMLDKRSVARVSEYFTGGKSHESTCARNGKRHSKTANKGNFMHILTKFLFKVISISCGIMSKIHQ
jgi:hypothetical protein